MPTHPLLAPYLLDALDDSKKAELERRLEQDSALRGELEQLRRLLADWASEETEHPSNDALAAALSGRGDSSAVASVTAHLLECRECRFRGAVLEAEQEIEPEAGSGARWRRAPRGPRSWLMALGGVAAGLILGWTGLTLLDGTTPAPSSTMQSMPVRLDAARGAAAETRVEMDRITGEGITLLVTARIVGERARWELMRLDEVVASGELRFSPDSAHLRDLALYVPRDRLNRKGRHVLVIRGPDGAEIGQWDLLVRH